MSGARVLLSPLGALYGAAAAARVRAYRRGLLPRTRLSGAVISVGNLSVGGSGKTPVVALVAATLQQAGQRVAVLSRGYGGSFRGPALVVSDGRTVSATAELAGDEPVMLARSLPGVIVAIGRQREEAGREVERRFGAVVHVLDDGFQHLRLERDLDVLCLGAGDAGDRPLPAGRLREQPRAAARADVLLLGDGAAAPAAARGVVFTLRRRVLGCATLEGEAQAVPRRAYLISGIARPERFAADAASCGIAVLRHRAFRDHHRFAAAEVEAAAAEARALGAEAILTTAKDAVRLPDGAWEPPLRVLRIAAEVVEADAFRERLLSVARGA